MKSADTQYEDNCSPYIPKVARAHWEIQLNKKQ